MRGDQSDTHSDHGYLENAPWLKVAHDSHAKESIAWRGLLLSKAKLKANSRTSGLLSGFAMIAMVELQVEGNIPSSLLIAFTVSASLLVTVHIMALMISTCILPNLESYSTMHDANLVMESPHEKMRTNPVFVIPPGSYIEMAWIFSTGLGILLFLVVVVLACWVKFWTTSKMAATAATVIIGPVVLLFIIFAVLFYRRLISHKFESTIEKVHELDTKMHLLDDTNGVPQLPTSCSGAVLQV